MTESGTDRSECYLCGDTPAENKAVVEKQGVHHDTNTLVCDDCGNHPRVVR